MLPAPDGTALLCIECADRTKRSERDWERCSGFVVQRVDALLRAKQTFSVRLPPEIAFYTWTDTVGLLDGFPVVERDRGHARFVFFQLSPSGVQEVAEETIEKPRWVEP